MVLQRPDNGGETPIDVAVRNEHLACAQLLTDALQWPQLPGVDKGPPRLRSSRFRPATWQSFHGKGADRAGLPAQRFQPMTAGSAGSDRGYF